MGSRSQGEHVELTSASISQEEDSKGGESRDGKHNSEHAELQISLDQFCLRDATHAPSPSIRAVPVDASGDLSPNKCVDHIRQVDGAVDKASPLQRGDVGENKRVH